MKRASALGVVVATIWACGGESSVPPASTAANVAPSEPRAAAPSCGPDAAGEPCSAPVASALPARGTACFSNQIMAGRMMCAKPDQSCPELHAAAIRVLIKGGNSAEDAKNAVGECMTTYWCATGRPADELTSACFADEQTCVESRTMTLGPDASGCVRVGP